jgi:heat shock protein HtpX
MGFLDRGNNQVGRIGNDLTFRDEKMREFGLKLRMAIASTVLMAVYALFGLFFFSAGGVVGVAIGLPLFIGIQYFVTVQLPLWTEESQEITPEEFPELHERADRLAEEFEIAKPAIYLIPDDRMNAFAHGRRGSGKVFLNSGLIEGMSIDELEPVLAHEFAHLKNRDSILMGLSTTTVSLISSGLFILFLIVSLDSEHPWLVRLVGAGVSIFVHIFLLIFVGMMSRYREYIADEAAVRATGKYNGMQSALRKLRAEKQEIETSDMSARRGAISFVDFTDGIVGRILATHPSVDKRISRIEDLKKESTKTTTEADRRTARSESVGSTDSTAEESSLDQYTNEQMIDALQTVDAYSFEELVADLWDAMGWETTVTTESKDRGVDVIAERGSPFHEKQIIQAKRYSDDNPSAVARFNSMQASIVKKKMLML